METQCWSDQTEWKPVNIQLPPVPNNEEDLANLGYMEEDLFNKGDQDPLNEYMSMETTLREGEHKELRYKAQTSFGLVMTGLKKEKRNLNPTIQEALAGEDKRFWEEAMCKELKGLEAMNTWETTDLPRDMNTVDMRWVLKIKTDANLIPMKYKARGVLVIAAVWGWEVDMIDVKQAYLNSSLHHDVYLKPPIRMKVQPGKVLKLVKGLYGLKQSGYNQLTVITAYVDDMLIASPSWKEVDHTKAEIMGKWEMEDNGSVKEFLGIKITRDRSQSKISLNLMAYIKGMSTMWLTYSQSLSRDSIQQGYCHGPGCSRSRRVIGSYGRSTGIEDLVDTSREHGRSAVSMETMDSYGLTCKGEPSHMRGGPGTATRRTKLKEQAQPRRGPSSDGYHSGARETRVIGHWQAGHEEEEQCRRSQHQVMRRRSSVEGVDTTQEAQGCQAGEAPEQYLMKRVLSGERAGAASLAML
ncbi:hypothetical protein NDA14_003470 [Ustilago hordei]|nr:hypothetical protein NDA14_003470 [Ustilago hordei]